MSQLNVKKFFYFLLSGLLLLPLVCMAQSFNKNDFGSDINDFGFYLGVGGGAISTNGTDLFEKDVQFKAGEVLGGVYWRWFGVEARRGLSLEDETINLGINPSTGLPSVAKTSIDAYTSYYLRLQLQNRIARVYALLGKSEFEITSEFQNGAVVEAVTDGNAYGLGAGVYINPNMNLNVEVKYLLKNEFDSFLMTGFNIELRF